MQLTICACSERFISLFAREPDRLTVGDDLDGRLEELPDIAAVFLLKMREGAPYLARTALLRRRLKRLLGRRDSASRILNLRAQTEEVLWWVAPSQIESSLTLYELAKKCREKDYLDFLKLRIPSFVRLLTANPFPRSQVTSRWSGPGLYYGPFRTRGGAEHFEHEFLDLFQMRRCQEDLAPSPEHPGCVYGEMNMCLRPCQERVGIEEYQSEVNRVSEFLRTGGRRLLASAASARDRLSAEMDFEAAAREHKRLERIEGVLKLRDELVCDSSQLCGVTVAASREPGVVRLWFMRDGLWIAPQDLDVSEARAESRPLDSRLRALVSALPDPEANLKDRAEHIALLSRWFYSSWRQGDWIQFEQPAKIPYRRLVNAVGRAAKTH
jgi:excinuclease ABC subunit C